MGKKITQAERVGAELRASMEQIMTLLEWDMLEYCMFKYECGLMYLEAYLKGDPESIDLMQREAAYWGWWKLHWMHREREFAEHAATSTMPWARDVVRRRRVYRVVHDGRWLADGKNKNSLRLDDSYCKDLVPSLRNARPVAISAGQEERLRERCVTKQKWPFGGGYGSYGGGN